MKPHLRDVLDLPAEDDLACLLRKTLRREARRPVRHAHGRSGEMVFEAALFPHDGRNHAPQLVMAVAIAVPEDGAAESDAFRLMQTMQKRIASLSHESALAALGMLLGVDMLGELYQAGVLSEDIRFDKTAARTGVNASEDVKGRKLYGFSMRFPVTRESYLRSDLARHTVPA